MQRLIAIAVVLGAAALAVASVGNGSVVASQPVLVIPIASGSGSGTDTLQNTTGSPYQVDVDQDVSCTPGLAFSIAGGQPFTLAGSGTKNIALDCPAAQPGISRCLLHATDTNGAALADFLQVCMVGASSTLVPSSATVDFTATAVPVGSTAMLPLPLRNNGSASIGKLYLQTTDLDGNFGFSLPCNLPAPFCDADIAPVDAGTSTTINVLCTPKTPGLHTARLYVATDSSQVLSQPVTLSCMATATATPVLDVNPPSVEVASPVEVLSGSASAVVHLSNTGGGTLLVNDVSITDVVAGANFDWHYAASGHCTGQIHSACQLGPGDLVDLAVTFDPSKLGARNASLVVSYTDTTARSRAIPLDGRGGGATLQLAGSVGPLDIGTVPVGRSSSLDFYVLNQGTRDTTATLSLMPNGAPFSLTPASSVDVPPTGTTKITATCTPTAAGSASTTITAESMDAFASPAIMLDATCNGTTQPLYAAPTALVFGEVRTTASPSTRTIMIASTGSALTLSGQPMLEADNPAITLGPLSGMTTPATFDVTVTPTAEGNIATHVLVSDSAGETIQIPLTASIVKPAYEVPSMLAVGTFCINQPTTPAPLQLTSKGTATITLQAPALGSAQSPFELSLTTPSDYPSELLPGQSAIVAVTPHPQPVAGGQPDTLTWTTDVENAPTATTAISANFIDSGGAIAPSGLDFGKIVVHLTRDDAQAVVIQNCNGSVLDLDAPTIKAPFSIDGPSVPAELQPNGTATFRIGFHPTELGVFTGTLLISSQQLTTPLMVTLAGEAVPGDPVGTDAGSAMTPEHHDTSFYACSCHATGVGGTAPIAFAVLLVVARRRRPRVR